MAESQAAIKRIIKRYIKMMTAHKIRVDKVYLFGSFAKGTAGNDSDIDIAVVSKDFSGDRYDDRRLIVPLRRKIDRRLEPIPFRTDCFKADDPMAREILERGIQIK